MPELDPDLYPRAAAYLVAGALGAHPEAQSKASVLRSFAEQAPGADVLFGDYRGLTGLDPFACLSTQWVPAADVVLFELMLADTLGSDEAFLEVTRRGTASLLSSPVFRAVGFVLSPARLLRTAESRWERFHRGMPLTVTAAAHGATLTLRYGAGLMPELVVREKTDAFVLAAELAGARDVTIEGAVGREESRFELRWR